MKTRKTCKVFAHETHLHIQSQPKEIFCEHCSKQERFCECWDGPDDEADRYDPSLETL